jgi:hypothetical protein
MTEIEYFITFNSEEDFIKASEMTSLLLPDSINKGGLEMLWNQEWWRNQAVHELDQVGIQVDTYELD